MTRILAWLLGRPTLDVYPVTDCGDIIDIATSFQGAELIRITHAQDLALMCGGDADMARNVERMVYNRQRIQHFVMRDVS